MKGLARIRHAVLAAAAGLCMAAANTACQAASNDTKRLLLQSWQSQTIHRPHSCVNDCIPDLDQNERVDREGPKCPPM